MILVRVPIEKVYTGLRKSFEVDKEVSDWFLDYLNRFPDCFPILENNKIAIEVRFEDSERDIAILFKMIYR